MMVTSSPCVKMGPFLTHIKFAAAGANNQQKQAKKPFIRIYKAIVKAKLGQNFCLILELYLSRINRIKAQKLGKWANKGNLALMTAGAVSRMAIFTQYSQSTKNVQKFNFQIN